MDKNTSLSIVKELRRLAENPSHRDYILRNDVNSILIFVDPDEHSSDVVTEAIKALECLAEEASKNNYTRRSMRNTVGLLESMKKIEERDGYPPDCKASAMSIQHLLNTDRTPITSPDSVLRRAVPHNQKRTKESVRFLGGNTKAKVITLQIEGLIDQDRRQMCVDELIRVKGVISLTFNMKLRRCLVRARAELPAEVLGNAVKATKIMEASQVMKMEDGNEVVLPLTKSEADEVTPEYLDEDCGDSPSKDDHAVARHGQGGQPGGFGNTWFGSIVNAVNKNLYW